MAPFERSFNFHLLFSESIKKAELDECFSERFSSNDFDNEFCRHLEIHLSGGNFQREFVVLFIIINKNNSIMNILSSLLL